MIVHGENCNLLVDNFTEENLKWIWQNFEFFKEQQFIKSIIIVFLIEIHPSPANSFTKIRDDAI